MEIQIINGFQVVVNSFQIPSSLITRLFHLSQMYSVWTWGALILALFAAFNSLVKKTKLVIFRLSRAKSVNANAQISQFLSETDEADDDDADDTCSCSTEDEDEEEDSTDLDSQASYENPVAYCENIEDSQGQNGNISNNSRAFSWTDFVNGKSVVKSWDGFASSSGNLLSFSDAICQIPVVSMPSPVVIVSAGFEGSKNVALKIWDTRAGRQIPEMFAELQPRRRKAVSQMYVRDLRKLGAPLENLTESDLKTWWDGGPVIVNGDGGSVVSRCRNAVLSCFNLDKVGSSD